MTVRRSPEQIYDRRSWRSRWSGPWSHSGAVIRAAVIALAAVAFQGALGAKLSLGLFTPHLGMLAIALIGASAGSATGAWAGFFVGLAEGSATGVALGGHIASRTFAGFVAGLLPSRLAKHHPLTPSVAAIAVVMTAELGLFLFAPSSGWRSQISAACGAALVNAILAFPAMALVKRWFRPSEE
ncbi:MAG: hypothetical protein HUU60_06300 [Armatimonadetes bacterium]|nr:hypothetical protein [Armatimonadota bacterium]